MERASITIASEDVTLTKREGKSVIDYPKAAGGTILFDDKPSTQYRMETSYQTTEDLKAAADRAQVQYQVVTSDRVTPSVLRDGIDPPLVYEATEGPLPKYVCITLVHPWWAENDRLPPQPANVQTQADSTFVPGVSPSTGLGTAPVKPTPAPQPAPQPAPETPTTSTSHTDDDSPPRVVELTVTFPAGETQHSWYTHTLSQRVRGCDTVHFVCRSIPTKSGFFRETEFQGSPQLRTIEAVDGSGRPVHKDEELTNSKSFTFDADVKDLSVWISNKGSAGEWGDMVLTVGANAKG